MTETDNCVYEMENSETATEDYYSRNNTCAPTINFEMILYFISVDLQQYLKFLIYSSLKQLEISFIRFNHLIQYFVNCCMTLPFIPFIYQLMLEYSSIDAYIASVKQYWRLTVQCFSVFKSILQKLRSMKLYVLSFYQQMIIPSYLYETLKMAVTICFRVTGITADLSSRWIYNAKELVREKQIHLKLAVIYLITKFLDQPHWNVPFFNLKRDEYSSLCPSLFCSSNEAKNNGPCSQIVSNKNKNDSFDAFDGTNTLTRTSVIPSYEGKVSTIEKKTYLGSRYQDPIYFSSAEDATDKVINFDNAFVTSVFSVVKVPTVRKEMKNPKRFILRAHIAHGTINYNKSISTITTSVEEIILGEKTTFEIKNPERAFLEEQVGDGIDKVPATLRSSIDENDKNQITIPLKLDYITETIPKLKYELFEMKKETRCCLKEQLVNESIHFTRILSMCSVDESIIREIKDLLVIQSFANSVTNEHGDDHSYDGQNKPPAIKARKSSVEAMFFCKILQNLSAPYSSSLYVFSYMQYQSIKMVSMK